MIIYYYTFTVQYSIFFFFNFSLGMNILGQVEEGCHLNTVDEIAAAVNHMLYRIEEATAFS